jgi:imidazole glycerol-phosphate synthase subunit HisH
MYNMFRYASIPAEVTSSPESLDRFSHLVLPGVGHYTEGTTRLNDGGWREPIIDFAGSGKPLLGVCLGMQLLGEGSEEGDGEGLGLLPFRLEKIPVAPGTPVPHMGWNTVVASGKGSPLLESEEEARFYFVHSFAVRADSAVAQGVTDYGVPFASVVGHENVHGVQFHPEKSHRFGLTLLRNFARESSWSSRA